MRKITPYLANGCPKICAGCGNPFVVRDERAEAILAPDNRLYCYRTHALTRPSLYMPLRASAPPSSEL